MLLRIKYIFIFLIVTASQSFSQTIQTINVDGNKVFSSSEIRGWAGINDGTKVVHGIIDSVKSRLAFQLAQRGYLHSTFNDTKLVYGADSQKVDLKIYINEGDPTYVKKINFKDVDSAFSSKILPMFEYMQGQIFNKFELEDDISNALTFYEDNGYPFAKIIVSSIYFYTDSSSKGYNAEVYLKFNNGVQGKIDKIEITGNKSTKDYVITRELRLKPGQEYSQKLIDELPKRLNMLGFFEPVSSPEFFLNSKNEGILRIKVKERQTNNFDGVVGYIPASSPNQGGYLTGLVNISLRNLFGTGRAASIKWQQYNQYSQDLELKYLEPWILNYPFNFIGSMVQRKQDSSYVQRKFQGTLEYLATDNVSASIFVSSESVIPTQLTSQAFTVYNSNAVTTGLNFKIDTRDDPYSPTEGVLFLNSYAYSRKKIYGPQKFITPGISTNVNLQRFSIDIDGYYQLFQRQVIALGLHGRELRGSFFEISDLFRLGGASTLRGYREDQFLGNRIMWTNLEYRLLLTQRTFTFAFLDTGYFLRNAEPQMKVLKSEGFKIGYGVGFNVETGLGELSISFALAKGDSFSDGKIHFGLVNQF
jgi:outer membrane protein insertion porin family